MSLTKPASYQSKQFKIANHELKAIKSGFYTSSYFFKSAEIAKKFFAKDIVTMQFRHFCKQPIMVGGMFYVQALLKQCLSKKEYLQLDIKYVKDGLLVSKDQAILLITGPYQIFAKFENLIDGILARGCSVATNCHNIIQTVGKNRLIYMADRSDMYLNQPLDGYCAYLGGIRMFSTKACTEIIKQLHNDKEVQVIGTIPHAIIQLHDGNLVNTIKSYNKLYQTCEVALIDYHNDIVSEIKQLAQAFKSIKYVRIDTSSNLVDHSLPNKTINHGVCSNLIKLARKTLDQVGFKETKIIISSNLDANKISQFKKNHDPVDIYGVGNALIARNVSISADLVLKNGKAEAKFGRKLLKTKF